LTHGIVKTVKMETFEDEIIDAILFNPHDHDFYYRRPDGSVFVQHIRKDGTTYSVPEIQLELPLNTSGRTPVEIDLSAKLTLHNLDEPWPHNMKITDTR
jgi:hypothetical protein